MIRLNTEKLLWALAFFFCCSTWSFAQENGKMIIKKPFTIGEILKIHSKVLDEKRTINIYLPDSYGSDPAKKYPVIYLLDGSRDEDFIHIAGLVQFSSFPWIKNVPSSIVVGIANVDRQRDFTFPAMSKQFKEDFPSSGGSSQFIEFLNSELIPYISKNYAVSDSSTLIGQSLGGLLATEILLSKPNTFNNYIIISPSLWWDDESLLEAPIPNLKEEACIYIGVGKEGKTMERVAEELYQRFKNEQKINAQLYYKYFEALDHGDVLHLAVYDAFVKIFSKN